MVVTGMRGLGCVHVFIAEGNVGRFLRVAACKGKVKGKVKGNVKLSSTLIIRMRRGKVNTNHHLEVRSTLIIIIKGKVNTHHHHLQGKVYTNHHLYQQSII